MYLDGEQREQQWLVTGGCGGCRVRGSSTSELYGQLDERPFCSSSGHTQVCP